MNKFLSVALAGAVTIAGVCGDDLVKLPEPDKQGGVPLMQALRLRKSARNFSEKPIPLNVLSNLLWAAQGVNREAGQRTAPTSKGCNEIDLYVVLQDAAYLYLPEKHALKLVVAKDVRKDTGMQDFAGKVPLNLVYVVDYSRQPAEFDHARKMKVALADTGFIGQNVYLYCASEGLITVFRAMVDCEKLGKTLGLGEGREVYFAQSVGYPDNQQ